MSLNTLPPVDALKAQAKRLRAALRDQGHTLTHSAALELLAQQHGLHDWNTLSAKATAATQLDPQAAGYRAGDRVEGTYLGRPFTGYLAEASQAAPERWQVTVKFDAPVDVVSFESFSATRSRVKALVDQDGATLESTSDGLPHMLLRRAG